MPFADTYRGKRVLVTGHTGFKGSWLAEWLLHLGAEVDGLALPPPTNPSLFEALNLEHRLKHHVGDIRDEGFVRETIEDAKPDYVFHLAAQSLVRESYQHPDETYAINVTGTINLLEALRDHHHPCAAIIVTSDKCYENREWSRGYREDDALGGADPYSSSKAACEIAVASWRRSFFSKHPVRIATGRAGNVIGGGDWAVDRLLPDAIRALQCNHPIPVRNKSASRPWQHVLEPLSGYLHLAQQIQSASARQNAPRSASLCGAFNFGPPEESSQTVQELVDAVIGTWPGTWEDCSDPDAVHEAKQLSLAIDKAIRELDWRPVWQFDETVIRTVSWYRRLFEHGDAASLTQRDIADYTAAARSRQIGWAQ
jgi:CDP-glucose 4,6-dehydratase